MINKNSIKIFLIDPLVITISSIFTFLIFDSIITKIYGQRAVSQFFESNELAGFINKRKYVGIFGGPLDEFSNKISIDIYGTRKVTAGECNPKLQKSAYKNVVFIGDSMVAGFEVKDSENYVSIISKKCISKGLIINGGVRAHDTHMASANAVRILKEFNLDQLNTVFVYGVTNNDFFENDNKNVYFNMKARFGSIFDQKNYKPKANLNYLRARMFVGNNFYFTTKFIHHYNKLRATSNASNPKKEKITLEKCNRLISILDSTFSSNSIESKVLLFVHPDFNSPEETKVLENCLISSTTNNNQISIIKTHGFMNQNRDKSDYRDFIFKRDPHYTPKGHKFISEILFPKLQSELSNNH